MNVLRLHGGGREYGLNNVGGRHRRRVTVQTRGQHQPPPRGNRWLSFASVRTGERDIGAKNRPSKSGLVRVLLAPEA
jgi:hypothetical protein